MSIVGRSDRADFQAERLSQVKEPRVVNLCVSVQSAITDSVIESHLRVVRLQDNHACVACGVEQHPRNLIAEPESHSTQLLSEEFLYAQSHRIHVCGRVIVFGRMHCSIKKENRPPVTHDFVNNTRFRIVAFSTRDAYATYVDVIPAELCHENERRFGVSVCACAPRELHPSMQQMGYTATEQPQCGGGIGQGQQWQSDQDALISLEIRNSARQRILGDKPRVPLRGHGRLDSVVWLVLERAAVDVCVAGEPLVRFKVQLEEHTAEGSTLVTRMVDASADRPCHARIV